MRPRGARRSPVHRILTATPHRRLGAIPSSFGVVPPRLSVLGNDTYGDCVTAEECAAKEAYSLWSGAGSELVISDAACIQWARQHGYLNGADLVSVLDDMARYGITATDGRLYHTGPHQSVAWGDYPTLCSAIVTGPVKIAVAANQLEQVVNSTNGTSGWVLSGAYRDQATDHCVGLWGYGTFGDLVALLKLKGIVADVPPGQSAVEPSVILYTWGTVGIATHQSVIAICDEAWVRTPTTVEQPVPVPVPIPTPNPTPTPLPPVPVPVPTPTPTPVSVGWSGTFQAGGPPWIQHETVTVKDGLIVGVQ